MPLSTSLLMPRIDRAVSPGRAYAFRVRAIDRAGHASHWQAGYTRRFTAYQESSPSLSYGGRWTLASNSSYWGGRSRASSTAGRTVSLRRTGHGFAWVAPVGPTRGTAKVYINGVFVSTVNLYSPTSGRSRVVFERVWATSGTRTITIRVSGTAGHPRVDVDGLIALN
jgi:hypothetical protein